MENLLSELAICSIKVNDTVSKIVGITIDEVYVFTQVWPNTTLGFGGIGGDAMTSAWTHVVQTSDGKYHIFFNGRHAYSVENATMTFVMDLNRKSMASIDEAKKLY